ncbi:MAG: hypothetical protein KDC98_25780 [Planctomycetes bacterium]|nr:hypothetical protein [Planctomycetota bacterium]
MNRHVPGTVRPQRQVLECVASHWRKTAAEFEATVQQRPRSRRTLRSDPVVRRPRVRVLHLVWLALLCVCSWMQLLH